MIKNFFPRKMHLNIIWKMLAIFVQGSVTWHTLVTALNPTGVYSHNPCLDYSLMLGQSEHGCWVRVNTDVGSEWTLMLGQSEHWCWVRVNTDVGSEWTLMLGQSERWCWVRVTVVLKPKIPSPLGGGNLKVLGSFVHPSVWWSGCLPACPSITKSGGIVNLLAPNDIIELTHFSIVDFHL